MNLEIILLIAVSIGVLYIVIKDAMQFEFRQKNRMVLIDTSVLIDGRILALAKSGFLIGDYRIPRSVIGELQQIADKSDSEKRARARYGLDVVAELQTLAKNNVAILRDSSFASEGVDERLLRLANKYNASIMTNDFNLSKVAKVDGTLVLNINDLAIGLRISLLPGAKTQLDLVQKGQDRGQAVGHLADGTMIVVENAKSQIGKSVEVEITRSLQTSAGQMMFAKLVSDNSKSVANSTKGKTTQSKRSAANSNRVNSQSRNSRKSNPRQKRS